MTSNRRQLLLKTYDLLLSAFGAQHWWPADSPFEVIVGAILTQNTAWKNVVKAIDALRRRGLLDFETLERVDVRELAELIRPSGYYNQKSLKLKAFLDHVRSRWEGDLKRFLDRETVPLRSELLSIRGIGPETADDIVLYAAGRPSFVVDAYTRRIFSRHGWIPEATSYDGLRDFFMSSLDHDVKLFQEYHALLVRTAHVYCRKVPECRFCPLHNSLDNSAGAENMLLVGNS